MSRYEFKLPDVGEGVHEGEIVKWLVKVGDTVGNDQPLVEVQTDKALVELPSPAAGTIVELNGAEGEIVNVGTVIVVIETEAGAAAAAPAPAPAPAAAAPVPAPAQAAPAPAPAVSTARPAGERALAAPTTRKLARELGVDINAIAGTGPAGRVTAEDVRAFAAGGAPTAATPVPVAEPAVTVTPTAPAALRPVPVPGTDERMALRGLRRKIAEKMVQSKFTAPHVTCVDEVDVTELKDLRAKANKLLEARGKKLTYMPFIIKAVIGALKEFPQLNSSLDEATQELVIKHYYNIGVAAATDQGLMVPVVHNADQLSLLQLGDEIGLLAEQARSRRIDLGRLQGGTFTISNIGNIGGLFATPVINYPEVAILGVNRIQARPVVRDGQIVVRDMMYLNLSFDHRVIDGDMAVMFLNKIIGYLESPNLMFMELV